jgi:hypothetical protein
MTPTDFTLYVRLDDIREVRLTMAARERIDAFTVRERQLGATEFLEVVPKLKDVFRPGADVASRSHLEIF